MITSPLSLSVLSAPLFFHVGEQNEGDLPPNAAPPSQADPSWMRRGGTKMHVLYLEEVSVRILMSTLTSVSLSLLQSWSGWS